MDNSEEKRQATSAAGADYLQAAEREEHVPADVVPVPFDFRHSNRLPNSQLSLIRVLHESFIRILSSSLSLYLRSFVSGNVVSVEQLSYGDFSEGMQSPTCIMYLSMLPYEGYATVEVNHALIAPILDYVLGGNGKINTELDREITEIEKSMLDGFFRIIPRELSEAWKSVVSITFAFDSLETEPQLSNRIARSEAVVAIAMELRIGDKVGTVNLAIPSITLKMLRHKFDQQSTTRKTGSSETEAVIKQGLSDGLNVDIDCAVAGSGIRLKDLLNLQTGHLLNLGIPCDNRATLLVNGVAKFKGEIIALEAHKQALVIDSTAIEQ